MLGYLEVLCDPSGEVAAHSLYARLKQQDIGLDMGALWHSKDSSWDQDDGKFLFKLAEIKGVACTGAPESKVALGQLLGAKRHSGQSGCGSAGQYFPPEFNRCPFCSEPLSAPASDITFKWLPPYGRGDGLKIFPASLSSAALKAGSGSAFPLPPRGSRFAFSVLRMGGEQRLLVAIDRVSGSLWVFNRDTSAWAEMSGRLGEGRLPSWSWAIASDDHESGICLPTQDGPAWVEVNWATGGLSVEHAAGSSVGGAVSIGKFVLAPVLRDGVFSVVYRTATASWADCSARSDASVVGPQLRRNSSQESACGIPVVDTIRNIVYWPMRGGYVKVSGFASGTPAWAFRPWETDEHPATALIELGPPLWRGGAQPGFWQLCEDRDTSVRDGIVNKLIKFDGDELADSEIVECGQFLSTGQSCFAWSDDYWCDIHQRNSRLEEQSELRFPLLQFGDRGLALVAKVLPWEGRDESLVFSDFVFNRASKNRVNFRLVIENEGTPEVPLVAEDIDGGAGNDGSLFRATLCNIAEISSFIHEDGLYVYMPEDNRCYRWTVSSWGA